MKRYGIRHKDSGEYLYIMRDHDGDVLDAIWLIGLVFLENAYDPWELLEELQLVHAEIVEADYGEPTIRVIDANETAEH